MAKERRFYTDTAFSKGELVSIKNDELHHIKNVLRMQVGDELVLFNNNHQECRAVIKAINDSELFLLPRDILLKSAGENSIELIQCMIKQDKMKLIVQKATEIGISTLYPIVSERTVVRPKEEFASKMCNKWQKIAINASKQCGRVNIPQIQNVMHLKDVLKMTDRFSNRIVFDHQKGQMNFSELIGQHVPKKGPSVFAVGPEGGFTDNEINDFKLNAFDVVSLSPLTMRSETAAICAAFAMSLFVSQVKDK